MSSSDRGFPILTAVRALAELGELSMHESDRAVIGQLQRDSESIGLSKKKLMCENISLSEIIRIFY